MSHMGSGVIGVGQGARGLAYYAEFVKWLTAQSLAQNPVEELSVGSVNLYMADACLQPELYKSRAISCSGLYLPCPAPSFTQSRQKLNTSWWQN